MPYYIQDSALLHYEDPDLLGRNNATRVCRKEHKYIENHKFIAP